MQNYLPGKTPDSIVDDRYEMEFELSDDFDLNNYADPAPEKNLEITAGDTAKGFAVGVTGALEGGAEVIKQTKLSLSDKARELSLFGCPVSCTLFDSASFRIENLKTQPMLQGGCCRSL